MLVVLFCEMPLALNMDIHQAISNGRERGKNKNLIEICRF